jgi:hypothetical protein
MSAESNVSFTSTTFPLSYTKQMGCTTILKRMQTTSFEYKIINFTPYMRQISGIWKLHYTWILKKSMIIGEKILTYKDWQVTKTSPFGGNGAISLKSWLSEPCYTLYNWKLKVITKIQNTQYFLYMLLCKNH